MDLDDLIESVLAALREARSALDERRESHLRALWDASERGEEPMLGILLPTGGGGERELSVPLASLIDPVRFQISRISLEFDCELFEGASRGAKGQSGAALQLKCPESDKAEKTFHMEVVFEGAVHPTAEVRVNGELLRESFGRDDA